MEECRQVKRLKQSVQQTPSTPRGDCPEFTPFPWDEHCQKCIRENGYKPEELVYCPVEDGCEYYKEHYETD